jgi:hypothetical protein
MPRTGDKDNAWERQLRIRLKTAASSPRIVNCEKSAKRRAVLTHAFLLQGQEEVKHFEDGVFEVSA